mgnify:CR=1 FL=1|tara:strand:+ start:238 stop:735 length:498 start_codon:yes stop_codon:yes gene_type:complete
MAQMDDNARLQLQKMISENNVEDQTGLIRELKHSHKLAADIRALQQVKVRFAGDNNAIHANGVQECTFLHTYYTDLYNKVKNDEIDLVLLNRFLNVLRNIEDGEVDQHEGSFIVGTILKEIYIDSALKKGNKLDAEHAADSTDARPASPVNDVSWAEFKKKHHKN